MEGLEKELYYAIDTQDKERLERALDEGADVDTLFFGACGVTRSTWAALQLCCEKGRYGCAELLLQRGADPNIADQYGQTPLMYAVCTEWYTLIPLLFKYGADLNRRDIQGMAAIHKSVTCSDTHCLELLMSNGADVDARDTIGCTPLHLACMEDGHLAHAQFLLKAGCDVNVRDAKEKQTPLQSAIKNAKKDRMAYVELLVTAGACLDLLHPKDDVGNHTALMTIIHSTWQCGSYTSGEELRIAGLLIDAGSDVNISAGFRYKPHLQRLRGPALKLAVERGMGDMADLLLSAGADPNVSDDRGATPLLAAALNNRLVLAKKLILYNSDLEIKGVLRLEHKWLTMTPFYCALYKGCHEFARLLVRAGYSLRYEGYLWNNQNVPMSLVKDLDFWLWLREQVWTPLPLRLLCRNHIRKQMGAGIHLKMAVLPLPTTIKHFLLLREIEEMYTTAL